MSFEERLKNKSVEELQDLKKDLSKSVKEYEYNLTLTTSQLYVLHNLMWLKHYKKKLEKVETELKSRVAD